MVCAVADAVAESPHTKTNIEQNGLFRIIRIFFGANLPSRSVRVRIIEFKYIVEKQIEDIFRGKIFINGKFENHYLK